MINKKTILYSILLAVTFLISEFIFNPSKLYFEIKWFDIIMHILGGFLLTGFVYNVSYINKILNKNKMFLILFALVLFIGILWEISEYIRDIYGNNVWGGWIDTIKDLIDDSIGVLIYIHRKLDK